MSSDNHLIWIFVGFVALIEVVSRKGILKHYWFRYSGFQFCDFLHPGEEVRVAFDTNDENIIRSFLLYYI